MVTLIKYGALSGGEKYNINALSLDGLSTDTKPIRTYIEYGSDGREVGRMGIPNGSLYTEIDTGDTYMYDADNTTWHKVSIGGGGGGTQGGIVLVGETTTALTDEATTNPITVDGQSYTAQPNDAVIYGSKEFLFDGTKWHEFGDLSGLASKDIGAMTGYAKASTGSAIATTDTLNQAIGKVEKRVEVNETNILTVADQTTQYNVANIYNAVASGITVSVSGYTATFSGTGSGTVEWGSFTATTTNYKLKYNINTKGLSFHIRDMTTETQVQEYYVTSGDVIANLTLTVGHQYTIRTYSNSAVSGAIKISIIPVDIYNAGFTNYQPYALPNAELTAKEQANENNISLIEQLNGAKNYIYYAASTETYTTDGANLTVTNNGDGTMTMDGTTGTTSVFCGVTKHVVKPMILTAGQYVLTGIDETSRLGVSFYITAYGESTRLAVISSQYPIATFTIVTDGEYSCGAEVSSGKSIDNLTLKPMVCKKSVYDSGLTQFMPYAMSNAEITAWILAHS